MRNVPTFARRDVEPVAGVRAELQERRGVAVLVVQSTVDERVGTEHELITLVQLTTARHADETPDVVDMIDSSHHELV